MSEDRVIVAGTDGPCSCGTCGVLRYADSLAALDARMVAAYVVGRDGGLDWGLYEPTGDQLKLALDSNRVIRAIHATGVARAIDEYQPEAGG